MPIFSIVTIICSSAWLVFRHEMSDLFLIRFKSIPVRYPCSMLPIQEREKRTNLSLCSALYSPLPLVHYSPSVYLPCFPGLNLLQSISLALLTCQHSVFHSRLCTLVPCKQQYSIFVPSPPPPPPPPEPIPLDLSNSSHLSAADSCVSFILATYIDVKPAAIVFAIA